MSVVKVLAHGSHSSKIVLLDDKTIMKVHKTSKSYKREVAALKKLIGCSFVQQITKLEPNTFTIYMTYCGSCIRDYKKYKDVIDKYNKILKERYKVFHNDLKRSDGTYKNNNICKRHDQLYIIDFSWASIGKKKKRNH
jgi:tRNA A-37 threonylcarbamoyl transferase component Bud32